MLLVTSMVAIALMGCHKGEQFTEPVEETKVEFTENEEERKLVTIEPSKLVTAKPNVSEVEKESTPTPKPQPTQKPTTTPTTQPTTTPEPEPEVKEEVEEPEDTEESTESSGTVMQFKTTAYCNCSKCCGKWAGGPTASGVMPVAGRTVAMGGVPFGTKIVINGHTYIVEDRGTPFGHVDIYFNTHKEALNYGLKYVTGEVIY